MEEFIMRMLNISGQAVVIFVVLLTVRGLFALGRVPRKYAYGMWAILFVRLLLPVQLETDWGLMPRESVLTRAVENAVGDAGQGKTAADLRAMEEQGSPDSGSLMQGTQPEPVGLLPEPAKHPGLTGWVLCAGVWASACAVLWGYGAFSYLCLKRRLRCRIPLEGWGKRVYLADDIRTPFVLGLVAPGIYLPSDMAQDTLLYVIAHERIHIKRRDYLVKLAAYLVACLYWFHPLVWVGFVLMSRDMEMSCDEAVLRQMGRDCRGEYADSLVRLACGKRRLTGVPLAFGEGSTRGRVRHIMKYKKSTVAAALAAAALTVVLAAVLLTSPRESGTGENQSKDLVYVQEVTMKNSGSSTVSYEPYRVNSVSITIDGKTYDLSRIMAEYGMGDINAITDVQCVDGRWLVEGHISPWCGTYSIYNIEEKKWEEHIAASCFAWDDRDEDTAPGEESSLDTAIYSLYNEIYSRRDGKLAVLEVKQVEDAGEALPAEEIAGLRRQGDQIYVTVRSTQTEEERTIEFSYEDARRGEVILK